MGILLVILLSGFVVIILFLKFYPAFGGKVTQAKRLEYENASNYSKGRFLNQIDTDMNMSFTENMKIMKDFVKTSPNRKPKDLLKTERPNWKSDKHAKVMWFGHSAFMLELDGKTLLLDPMFGSVPSPVPIVGGKRYSGVLPVEIEELPWIDAVLFSHDHYDHLDYGSIKKLKDKVGRFIVPLGVGSHLQRWGVEPERIQEHNWWNELEFVGLHLVCTPARHFSGRGLTGRNSTLWCSWVISGKQAKIYFSGDSGYGPHFKEIGEKYGPFDIALMECGQYDERWSTIHMMPEETVQAHLDVKGKWLIPIHWGAFTLALHDWTDPVERVKKAAEQRGVSVSTPRIGEIINIGNQTYPSTMWWK
ncbi:MULTISPECIES: MBL fold metallo-hydrolase [unclassified Bacillus (in: firmicutes)]|uniref:MBL fold metallo-hydrolase n=1 Tax=unclassified Bacillus (in: firmicutes) TaxID=185979 RepID=UPI0008ECFAD1|nr:MULTISPECIES: MBL fold metallo-hydrolase [unclassified Bacillus (in: firmicutes)]SFB02843.1 L-ascorbate metabolism protein UlaG, beta-lactamase superfamily [Bacillus sp. UNCCL13]SFQ88974.1 L-ascorbate metabolism protein UlaG, beta-lactamase superfamily [Bacillus sp. cl95]